jgi:hypothetical protein
VSCRLGARARHGVAELGRFDADRSVLVRHRIRHHLDIARLVRLDAELEQPARLGIGLEGIDGAGRPGKARGEQRVGANPRRRRRGRRRPAGWSARRNRGPVPPTSPGGVIRSALVKRVWKLRKHELVSGEADHMRVGGGTPYQSRTRRRERYLRPHPSPLPRIRLQRMRTCVRADDVKAQVHSVWRGQARRRFRLAAKGEGAARLVLQTVPGGIRQGALREESPPLHRAGSTRQARPDVGADAVPDRVLRGPPLRRLRRD